ncbi:dual specificity protein phosphatase 22-B isoform X1 [Haplochromis burtoni]|uniref:Dual specificity phosphatase 22 n=1 Tax=Haplochromis burtoni TaxID=8153 RepID=A0A3Q2W6I6_HAPBU|nr:dual specificity protein phosphatase 22-B isoform X1 [Haplochromis burtoni]XP_005937298.1 dual specificity protein phosphatase 22-B isoform X1 [Haplochromis burtoni]XP_042078929.1 dual specificity protein phosphatase 22-B isoform X1 [Haplochromis burtoni]
MSLIWALSLVFINVSAFVGALCVQSHLSGALPGLGLSQRAQGFLQWCSHTRTRWFLSTACTISCQGITYLCISAADHSKQNLIQYFRDSIMFIHESRLKGEGCLVHCMAGVSRSVTLVVAYIMTVTGHGWVESLAAVRSVRPCAGPNLGFLRQLEEFENTELTEYRAWWKELYGKSTFSDDEEIEALLNRKSSTSDAITTSITPALATSSK